MLRFRSLVVSWLFILGLVPVAWAGDIVGTVVDATGAVLPAARVALRHAATGSEVYAQADLEGRFRFAKLAGGTYLVTVESDGFTRDSKTVTVTDGIDTPALRFELVPGGVAMGVTVTATRSERDQQLVPLRTDSVPRHVVESRSPISTGDALIQAPGITPVGSGPVQVRPRVRGLDSTRLLILVDGERLNNARTATDRSGTEVGLVDLSTIDTVEVVSGSGSVLYGTDALAGTVNIITNQPRFSDTLKLNYGFDGYASSNENGRRGTVSVGASARRFAFQLAGSLEGFDDYQAGGVATNENTNRFFASGQIKQADTIDDNFGFNFKAFPDPFNAPFTRTTSKIPTSSATGNNINASGLVALSGSQTLQVKYLRRRIENAGFPDFEPPMFFQRVSLPYNNLDRVSARYEARSINRWFTNLKVSTYFQDQHRLLRNQFPVQFPAPSATFFPISVFQLQIESDTEQHVQTPGLDVQATLVPARNHVITAGMMIYSDRSEDSRSNITQSTMIGSVALGARGPQADVFASPVILGPPSTSHPVRVPVASFKDVGFFAQDEWDVTRHVRLVAGLRVDQYRVTTKATPGYDVASLTIGATPAIDPATLPSVAGDKVSRAATTGDLGVVFRPSDAISVLARYGRSYRHPNLEELLYSGPATVGAIVPNLKVRPETGRNLDLGVKIRTGRVSASVSYFNNTYDGFISTEIVATTASGPLSQAINFTDVRIQGVEGAFDVPVLVRPGVITLFGNAAFTRGTVLDGRSPLTGASLAGTPQDNISPFKGILGVRFNDARDRWWVEYGVRSHARVSRVALTLLDSPYLIAQDLLGLDGFTIQRLGWGINLRPRSGRVGVVFAVENLGDRFYREQFQFAPARGRSFTLGLHVRGL